MLDAGVWERARLFEYWDSQTDGLRWGATTLGLLPKRDWPAAAQQIRQAIRARAEALSEPWLVMTGWVMAEDLYKQFTHRIWKIEPQLYQYLETTVGSFLEVLSERGSTLNYVVERAQGERRHFIFLECDASIHAPDLALRGRGQSGVVWAYRNEAPVPGSRGVVVPPSGITLPTFSA